jgi:hypothetical protein
MSIKSIFNLRLSTMALSLAATLVAVAGVRAQADEPISLRQPATTLVITAVNLEEASSAAAPAIAQPSALQPAPAVAPKTAGAKQSCCPAGRAAPFTPHYLCLCPTYCPKPMPCVDCCYKCCPDCYCPKPMPCPNPCYDCTCDDYCSKPMPCPFPQPLCGPRAPCRQSEPSPLYAPFPPRGPCVGP